MGDIKHIRRLRRYLESKLSVRDKYGGPPETWTDDEVREFAKFQCFILQDEFGLNDEQRKHMMQTMNPTLLERMRELGLTS